MNKMAIGEIKKYVGSITKTLQINVVLIKLKKAGNISHIGNELTEAK